MFCYPMLKLRKNKKKLSNRHKKEQATRPSQWCTNHRTCCHNLSGHNGFIAAVSQEPLTHAGNLEPAMLLLGPRMYLSQNDTHGLPYNLLALVKTDTSTVELNLPYRPQKCTMQECLEEKNIIIINSS